MTITKIPQGNTFISVPYISKLTDQKSLKPVFSDKLKSHTDQIQH